MSSLPLGSRALVAVALVVPVAAALWIVRDPALVSPSTMGVLAVAVFALAAVAVGSWKSAQAATTTSQIIHEVETANIRHQKAPPRI